VTSPIAHLEPRELWARFDEIRKIPRPSKHEEQIRKYVIDYAADNGLTTLADNLGNVVVRVPATPGHENAPTVVLQGHLDMVCEKNADKDFDFSTDPIDLVLDGDTLKADGTTLGADNGVGLAAGLAMITDTSITHGPLELLFTLDEETGLTGARELDATMLKGKYLLNLDSEEDGVIIMGCAGGRDTEIKLNVKREAAPSGSALRIKASGMSGGHSGIDIHLGRANAIQVLHDVLKASGDLRIASVSAGSAHNAIPREAEAVVFGDPEAVKGAAAEVEARRRKDHGETDPELKIEVEAVSEDLTPLNAASTESLMNLIEALPHGVLGMSEDFEGVVETSSNLAVVRSTEAEVEVLTSTRSSVMGELNSAVERIVASAQGYGAEAVPDEGYPSWEPNPDSGLLKVAVGVYEKLYGEKPEVKSIHAGLECGIIGEQVKGMDMISIGPTLRNPHSPSEEVSVSSVKKMLGDYLNEILLTLTRV